MIKVLLSLYKYRGFVLGSVKREFQIKYQNSLFGAAWTIINPLAMIFVYTVIFSQVMKAKLPGTESMFAYSIYLCAGIITWTLFAEIVERGQNIFIENANIIKKLNFPRRVLPIIVVLSASLNFSITFILFLFFLLFSGNFPGWEGMAIIPVLMIQIFFAIGLGVSLGVLNVFFRDIGQLFKIVLQFWFWLTPIVYPVTILPEYVRSILLTWNPMAAIIASYQTILVKGELPDWNTLIIPSLVSIMLCGFAMRLFEHHADEIVDEL